MITDEQYKKATEEIEKVHSTDISTETENGISYPAELLYSNRMLAILDLVSPDCSNAMKLAAQCQHFQRWGVPRSDFPYDRRGYHQWRRVVMEYQLKQMQQLLSEVTLDEEDIRWIMNTLRKQGDKSDSDAQIIMDTACLVFLKWYMEPFAKKHETEKVTDILKKTMRKISSSRHNLISKLDLPEPARQLLEQAANPKKIE
jgi:hypothetical protein